MRSTPPFSLDAEVLSPHSGKTVAVGAVSFYIDHFVQARITKFAYGTTCSTIYKPSNPEHVKRKNRTFKDELGHTYVPDVFTTMLSKVLHRIISPRLATDRHHGNLGYQSFGKPGNSETGSCDTRRGCGNQSICANHQIWW